MGARHEHQDHLRLADGLLNQDNSQHSGENAQSCADGSDCHGVAVTAIFRWRWHLGRSELGLESHDQGVNVASVLAGDLNLTQTGYGLTLFSEA